MLSSTRSSAAIYIDARILSSTRSSPAIPIDAAAQGVDPCGIITAAASFDASVNSTSRSCAYLSHLNP